MAVTRRAFGSRCSGIPVVKDAIGNMQKGVAMKVTMEPAELAEFRHAIYMRGWMRKSEMERFLQIGRCERVAIWEKLEKEIEEEGKRTLGDKMMASRVMKYAGLTPKRIVGDYERLVN